MYKRLRNLFYVGCAVILIAAYVRIRVLADRQTAANPTVSDSTTVDQGDIVLTVSAAGPIHAEQELPLAFLLPGKVATINASEGDHVLKGQTLATLNTDSQQVLLKNAQLALNLQQVAYNALIAQPRQVDVKAAQSALDAAQAQLAAAQVGYDPLQVKLAELQVELAKNLAWQSQLQRDMAVQNAKTFSPGSLSSLYNDINLLPSDQRAQALAALNTLSSLLNGSAFGVSPKDAEAAVHKTNYDIQIAQAQLAVAKDAHADSGSIAAAQVALLTSQSALDQVLQGGDPKAIEIAATELKASQAALDLARYQLSQGTLIAPFDGVVAKINLAVGETPPTDQPAILMLDDSGFYVDIPVDEADISKVRPNQAVTLVFDSLPNDVITGSVERIATMPLQINGVVSYPVHVQIQSDGHALRSGMSTTATITIDQIHDVLRLRNRFIGLDRTTGNASVLVRRADGTIQSVQITLGLRNDTYSEVKSGLALGDEIVVLPRDATLGN